MQYIIKHASQKRDELVLVPKTFEVHDDYKTLGSQQEIIKVFNHVHNVFFKLLTCVIENPQKYGYPSYDTDEFHYASKEARSTRLLPYDAQYLLFYLLNSGEVIEDKLKVNILEFRKINKVKKIHNVFMLLQENGFLIEGLENFKIPRSKEYITLNYSSNSLVIKLMYIVARKVMNTVDLVGFSHYENHFLSWNYRILSEPSNICTINSGAEYVADRIKDSTDNEFCYKFHEKIKKLGFAHQNNSWNEGPHISYYHTEKQMINKNPYLLRIFSFNGQLRLFLRLRNPEACFEYVDKSTKNIKDMFGKSDISCENRKKGTCMTGTSYTYNGKEVWKCGCWKAAFVISPRIEEIDDYLKLLELGEKK